MHTAAEQRGPSTPGTRPHTQLCSTQDPPFSPATRGPSTPSPRRAPGINHFSHYSNTFLWNPFQEFSTRKPRAVSQITASFQRAGRSASYLPAELFRSHVRAPRCCWYSPFTSRQTARCLAQTDVQITRPLCARTEALSCGQTHELKKRNTILYIKPRLVQTPLQTHDEAVLPSVANYISNP